MRDADSIKASARNEGPLSLHNDAGTENPSKLKTCAKGQLDVASTEAGDSPRLLFIESRETQEYPPKKACAF